MNLDEAQRKRVAAWIAEGLKLSEIQNRLASELKIHLTYMDVRLLVDDLKLTPKDAEPPKAAVSPLESKTMPPAAGRKGLDRHSILPEHGAGPQFYRSMRDRRRRAA